MFVSDCLTMIFSSSPWEIVSLEAEVSLPAATSKKARKAAKKAEKAKQAASKAAKADVIEVEAAKMVEGAGSKT